MNINPLSWFYSTPKPPPSVLRRYPPAQKELPRSYNTPKIMVIGALALPLLVMAGVQLIKIQLKIFRVFKVILLSAVVAAIVTAYRYKIIDLKSTVIFNGLAFLSYYL